MHVCCQCARCAAHRSGADGGTISVSHRMRHAETGGQLWREQRPDGAAAVQLCAPKRDIG